MGRKKGPANKGKVDITQEEQVVTMTVESEEKFMKEKDSFFSVALNGTHLISFHNILKMCHIV